MLSYAHFFRKINKYSRLWNIHFSHDQVWSIQHNFLTRIRSSRLDDQCNDTHRNPVLHPHVDINPFGVQGWVEKELGKEESNLRCGCGTPTHANSTTPINSTIWVKCDLMRFLSLKCSTANQILLNSSSTQFLKMVMDLQRLKNRKILEFPCLVFVWWMIIKCIFRNLWWVKLANNILQICICCVYQIY